MKKKNTYKNTIQKKAYPPLYLVTLGVANVSAGVMSSQALIADNFRIPQKDIIKSALNVLKTETHKPGYYLAIDHKKECIVLSIRGSTVLSDFLTDVDCAPTQFKIGNFLGGVHEGNL